ncbi:unnamed protein product [Ranitomeya imitator]|uniref:Protein RER1 n=1 Tax=Ranitomeya imitator TaxID=111125 RepID=A0ABN9KPS1_9NEOB|nr:unnamed protein product [Ranitomeya imitator]
MGRRSIKCVTMCNFLHFLSFILQFFTVPDLCTVKHCICVSDLPVMARQVHAVHSRAMVDDPRSKRSLHDKGLYTTGLVHSNVRLGYLPSKPLHSILVSEGRPVLNGRFRYGVTLLLLRVRSISAINDEGPSLPTKQNEEFRPFIRRLPEFKFWHSATKGVVVAMVCTFFEAFNVPVFWPILVMYFIMLFCITMKRQIKHMIKYRYIPFTHGKRKYKGKEETGKPFSS